MHVTLFQRLPSTHISVINLPSREAAGAVCVLQMLSPHRDKGQTDKGREAAGGFSPQTHTGAGTHGCRCSPRPMPLREMPCLYLTGNTKQKHLQKVSLTRSNAKSVYKLEQRQSRQGWAPVFLLSDSLGFTHMSTRKAQDSKGPLLSFLLLPFSSMVPHLPLVSSQEGLRQLHCYTRCHRPALRVLRCHRTQTRNDDQPALRLLATSSDLGQEKRSQEARSLQLAAWTVDTKTQKDSGQINSSHVCLIEK